MRKPPLPLIAILTLVLAVAGVAPASLSRTDAHATGDPSSATQIPDTPVGVQLAWTLRVLNGGGGSLTEVDLIAHAAPNLLASSPPEQLMGTFQELAMPGPFELLGFTRPPTNTQVIAFLAGAGGERFVLLISVEATAPHRITGLSGALAPAPADTELRPFAQADAGPGQIAGRFDIGGRQMYLSCRGTGGPTVVLESGLADTAASWFGLESAVAGFTRVCSYDRANTPAGASDPAAAPRGADEVVADLHALLTAAGVPGPYVLVGHSDGGMFVRQYAGSHPAEVAGLVLVDAAHEDQDVRLMSLMTPDLQEVYLELLAQAAAVEGIDPAANSAQVRSARATRPLRAMPLVVIAAGGPQDPSLYPPNWPVAAHAALHRELQVDLAGLLPGGELVIAEHSGHYIHHDEPGLVVDTIRRVVETVRQQATTP